MISLLSLVNLLTKDIRKILKSQLRYKQTSYQYIGALAEHPILPVVSDLQGQVKNVSGFFTVDLL